MSGLHKRISGDSKPDKDASTRPPFVFMLVKKCQKYGIDYHMMKRLNYSDLLALIVEYDIEATKEHLRMLEESRNTKANRVVKQASNSDILSMHGRR